MTTLLDILIPASAGLKSLLLLLVLPNDPKVLSKMTEEDINNFMKPYNDLPNQQEIREMVSWVKMDDFTKETLLRTSTFGLTPKLEKLKTDFLTFYTSSLVEIESRHPDMKKVLDVHSKIGQYVLQMMRLRMVIQPEIQISKNVHPVSKIKYISAKGYWIDDKGQKIRKFTKSLGRAEEYPGGIKDPKAHAEGIVKIQETMLQEYSNTYG